MIEALTKASQNSSLLLADIKQCYQEADPITEIVLRGLLKDAVELERKLKELNDAISAMH